MPEGVGYGPQTTASTGLSLNVIGKHAYAYSGAIALDNSTNENTYLDFKTGSYYFVGTLLANNLDLGAGTDDLFYTIYFNGVVSQAYIVGGAKTYTSPDNLIPLIIPPYTEVKVTAKDVTQASTIENTISITGRIYK